MWLLKNMAQNSKKEKNADRGEITLPGQTVVNISASGEHTGVPLCAPCGIAYVPAQGEQAVILPIGNGGVCIGAPVREKGLSPGEIMLYSAGGATLVLKNDGTILANGRDITGGA